MKSKEEILEDLTIEEMNNNTIMFNKFLKEECQKNSIKYFDLIEETSYYENNNLYLQKEFIGSDHYNGCQRYIELNIDITEYNNLYNCEINDYFNNPLFK